MQGKNAYHISNDQELPSGSLSLKIIQWLICSETAEVIYSIKLVYAQNLCCDILEEFCYHNVSCSCFVLV